MLVSGNSSLFRAAALGDVSVGVGMEGDEDLKAGEGKKGVNSVGGAGCPATENCRLVTEVVPTRIPTLPQNYMCRYLLSGICFCIACAVLAGGLGIQRQYYLHFFAVVFFTIWLWGWRLN